MASTPPDLLTLASSHYRAQQITTRNAAMASQAIWSTMPTDGALADKWAWWAATRPALTDLVALSQFTTASRAGDYVKISARLQGLDTTDVPDLSALAFISATADVEEWLDGSMARTSQLITDGAPAQAAKISGLASLLRMTATLAQDSGREAVGAGISAHPDLSGYFRHLTTPSCSRCAILAGAYYRWSASFKRHPLCDCTHVPAAHDYDDGGFDAADAIRAGKITGLSEDERKAIVEDGADPSQVVNVHRKGSGVQTSNIFGQNVKTTTSGTTRRGAYGSTLSNGEFRKDGGRYRVAKVPRLTPSEIYRQANGDKAHARRLLAKYGYTN